jgi:malate dehydrogenase (oxaloacetate-decarboxylating)
MDDRERTLAAHSRRKGKIEIAGVAMETKEQLSDYYTPGVAYVSLEIKKDKAKAYDYTMKARSAAIITDGTRILGLGDVGPEAGLPVMEGKSMLLKKLGGVDALPICLATKDRDSIIAIAKALEPEFGVMNIEDIETPKCLEIVDRLRRELSIPVFHDDREGVAVVTLAALTNALRLAGKRLDNVRIVVNGAGAAGIGIAQLLSEAGAKHIIMCDTAGTIYKGRAGNMNPWKDAIAASTNEGTLKGALADAARGADVLIGASVEGAFTPGMISSMAGSPIVFALANPYPEIDYKEALDAGAFIAATGRSDRPNQVNNLIAFPGIMRGLLEARVKGLDYRILTRAARIIARFDGKRIARDRIIPDPMDRRAIRALAPRVAAEVARAAQELGIAGSQKDPAQIEREAMDSITRYSRLERSVKRIDG